VSRVMQARIAFAAMGVVVWGYGFASDDANIRLVGMALLALSLVLRFVDRRPRKDDDTAM
jgi:hypothetical protein